MTQAKVRNEFTYRYVPTPTEIYTGEKYRSMSHTAKILYAILLDRHSVSVKNHWFDKVGVFIFYRREDACVVLNCSKNTVKKAFDELIEYDLIAEVDQGAHRPKKIYVGLPENVQRNDGNVKKAKQAKNYLADKRKEFLKKLNTTIKAKTEACEKITALLKKKQDELKALSATKVSNQRISFIKQQLNYAYLKKNIPAKQARILDTTIQGMAEMQTAPQTKIGNNTFSWEYLSEVCAELTDGDMLQFLKQAEERVTATPICNIKAYIKTMLIGFVENIRITYGSRFDDPCASMT